MNRQMFRVVAVLWCGTLLAERAAAEPPWPQFRGPNGCGIAVGSRPLPSEFGPTRNVLWQTSIPPGFSSPCVWGDRIFLTSFDAAERKLETLAIDRTSGRIVWRQSAPAEKIEKVHEANSPATATPASDGERVYVYFGSYGLLAYDFDGNLQWSRPLPTPATMFGTGTSPIVIGDLVLLNCDQGGPFGGKSPSYLLAVRAVTGETAWQKERRGFASSHATPLHWREDDTDEVIVRGAGAVVAYSVADGAELWRVNGLPISAASTPAIAGDRMFLAGTDLFGDSDPVRLPAFQDFLREHDADGDGKLSRSEIPKDFAVLTRGRGDGVGDFKLVEWFFSGADRNNDGAIDQDEWDAFRARMEGFAAQRQVAAVAVRLGGRGDLTRAGVMWRETKAVPEVPSPLYYNGKVYLIKNGGIVSCLDGETGELKYRERLGVPGSYYASPVAGDGKIYAASLTGMVVVFDDGDKLNVLARNNLDEPIAATPALVDGTIYVRTESRLYGFGEPAGKGPDEDRAK
jgi:outer membrane protein assembly factor BamB